MNKKDHLSTEESDLIVKKRRLEKQEGMKIIKNYF